MKILVINPNSSEAVTAQIMESARRAASAGTELVGITTQGGIRNIDSGVGAYLSGRFMIRTGLVAVGVHKTEASVLGAFGLVGIARLKQVLTILVVSIAPCS